VTLDIIIIFSVQRVEWKIIRKYIYKSVSWWEFIIERRKKGKTLLNLLSISTKGSLMIDDYLDISLSSNRWWCSWMLESLDSKIKLIIWFGGSKCAHKRNHPLSFFKWRWMGIRLVIASIPNIGDVQNTPVIYIAALLLYIFLSFSSRYASSTLL